MIASFSLLGCLDPFAPEVGAPLHPICRDEDSDPAKDIVFSTDILETVLKKDCGFCHFPDGGNPIGITIGGLDVSSYASLRRGGANSLQAIIVPDRPCESILIQKVMDGPPFGARMPLNGPPYLSATDINLLRDWIAEGARE
jgi:hypothetical protein